MGPYIEAPSIPAPSQTSDVLPVLVQVNNFKDIRLPSEEGGNLISPEGDVGELVKDSFVQYLVKRGATVEVVAPVIIDGEIRNWEAQAKGTTTGALNSTASLYLEVRNNLGAKIYSGVFQGTRSSQFPLVGSADIKDSLGFAISQAIDQALNDPSLRKALSSSVN